MRRRCQLGFAAPQVLEKHRVLTRVLHPFVPQQDRRHREDDPKEGTLDIHFSMYVIKIKSIQTGANSWLFSLAARCLWRARVRYGALPCFHVRRVSEFAGLVDVCTAQDQLTSGAKG